MEDSAPVHPAANLPLAVDLFASKKHPHLPSGVLGFVDSSGKTIFTVNRRSLKSSPIIEKSLLDSRGNPLISVCRHQKACWQGFEKADDGGEKLLFRVKRTRNKFSRTQLEVFLARNGIIDREDQDSSPDFKVTGCPFQRSCTIYRADSIVAQTSLMYKLHQIYAGRSKFRVTLFPGSNDTALLVALVVIFLDGRK